MMYGQYTDYPAIANFLDWNHCYKSAATHILQDDGLASYLDTVYKYFPTGVETSNAYR